MRHEYGKFLVELGKRCQQLVVLEADLKESTQSVQFQESFPARYFEMGVAEQNMVGIAAGMALEGKIPFVHSFACFISMRSCEQVRTSVAYPNLNVKFVVTHAGISTGTAGTTHHAIEDIAIMRSIPNITVLAPADAQEMRQAVIAALRYKGPCYIRLSAIDAEDVFSKEYKFKIGKAALLHKGSDVTLVTTGTFASEGMSVARILLDRYKIRVRLLHMASIKPIDTEALLRAAEETRKIITLEEHNIIGGLGSAVCEVVSGIGAAKVKRLGINDHFCDVGSMHCLLEGEGLTTEGIVEQVYKFIKK